MKVKICGITRLEDATLSVELGAWAIGFIFYPKSPRYISPGEAKRIIKKIPTRVRKVGVFVDESRSDIHQIRAEVGIDIVQLHGGETPDFVSRLGGAVIKSFSLRSQADLDQLAAYRGLTGVLVDGYDPKQRGGTGTLSNWELARRARRFGNIVLAGGLNAENVGEAVQAVEPWAVDLSSGVELAPGIKDPSKLRAFFSSLSETVVKGTK